MRIEDASDGGGALAGGGSGVSGVHRQGRAIAAASKAGLVGGLFFPGQVGMKGLIHVPSGDGVWPGLHKRKTKTRTTGEDRASDASDRPLILPTRTLPALAGLSARETARRLALSVHLGRRASRRGGSWEPPTWPADLDGSLQGGATYGCGSHANF